MYCWSIALSENVSLLILSKIFQFSLIPGSVPTFTSDIDRPDKNTSLIKPVWIEFPLEYWSLGLITNRPDLFGMWDNSKSNSLFSLPISTNLESVEGLDISSLLIFPVTDTNVDDSDLTTKFGSLA